MLRGFDGPFGHSPMGRLLDGGNGENLSAAGEYDYGASVAAAGPANSPPDAAAADLPPLLSPGGDDDDNGGGGSFDRYQLFWIINGVSVLLFICVLIACCRRRGDEFVSSWAEARASGSLSDTFYERWVMRRREEEAERKKESPERRRERLQIRFESSGVRMVVKEGDYVGSPEKRAPGGDNVPQARDGNADGSADGGDGGESGDAETADDDNRGEPETAAGGADAYADAGADDDTLDTGAAAPAVLLPPAGGGAASRAVPNCCAVCLCPYEVDDALIWSSNPSCQHAFHEECVVEWLVKMQTGAPCPCCRQEFVDLPDQEEEGEKEDPLAGSHHTSAFDLGSISIR